MRRKKLTKRNNNNSDVEISEPYLIVKYEDADYEYCSDPYYTLDEAREFAKSHKSKFTNVRIVSVIELHKVIEIV